MPYRVLTTKRVEKQFDAMPQQLVNRVKQHIETLREDPRPFGVKKLRGYTNTYRVRVGNHRIIYTIDDLAQTITLLTIDDRKDVYR